MTWLHGRGKPWTFDLSFRTSVAESIKGVVTRAETLACKLEREQVSVCSTGGSVIWLTPCRTGCPKSYVTQRKGNRSHSQEPRGHVDKSGQLDENDGDLRTLVLEILSHRGCTCAHHPSYDSCQISLNIIILVCTF